MELFDLSIIGMGVAGCFALTKIAKEYKNMKVITFDTGRPPAKRRSQCEGFLGCLPNSDGKLFLNDIQAVSGITGTRKAKAAERWFNDYLANILDLKVVKDRMPLVGTQKRIKKAGFDFKLNNYIQMYPKDIHLLSKYMSNLVSVNKNITMSFDNEVLTITKNKKSFVIISNDRQIECKRIIVCTGRSGWRWTKQLYDTFGIIESNDVAKFGIRIEASTSVMKDFNKSNCSVFRQDLDIGPLCWNGTVIPEDHIDLAISSFRSNENRWKSDKVSFNLIGHRQFDRKGFEQTNRVGQLTFILANDRIVKEKISLLFSKKSKISIMEEYNWLQSAINDISQFMPDISTKGYFHIPTILPLIPKIQVSNNMATEVDGMFCTGEAAGIVGLLAAATTGLIAADGACK